MWSGWGCWFEMNIVDIDDIIIDIIMFTRFSMSSTLKITVITRNNTQIGTITIDQKKTSIFFDIISSQFRRIVCQSIFQLRNEMMFIRRAWWTIQCLELINFITIIRISILPGAVDDQWLYYQIWLNLIDWYYSDRDYQNCSSIEVFRFHQAKG